MTTPVLLQTRVDALTVGYKLHVSGAVNDEITERQTISDLARAAEFRAGGFRFLMRRNRSIERFFFGNHDCRCCFDRTAPAGWNFEVVVGAPFLATHPLSAALALSNSVAEAMGDIEASHLRRVDPMADYMHFALRRLDASRFFTTRARRKAFLVHAKDLQGSLVDAHFHEYLDAGRKVTGVCIAPGNPLSSRAYDKVTELALPGREEKRGIEFGIWKPMGFTGVEAVTRIELQFRSEALESFGLRNPENLESNLDGLWQYGVARWMRLIKPTRQRRRECPLDPRWEPVVATVFRHPAEPAKRKRVRGGASAQQALGTTLSRLGSIGKLPKIAQGDEAAFVKSLGPEMATSWLMQSLSKIFEAQTRDCFEQLVLRYGAEPAAVWLLQRVNAIRAGYWSVDDLHEELLGPADDNGVILG
jgi:hypothetical protein